MTRPLEETKDTSALKRALFALKDMRQKLQAVEQAKVEPIAIIGMGCRFPGSVNTPEAFWQLLHTGVDAIGEIPANRWDIEAYYDPDLDASGKMYTRQAGFIDQVDQFDAPFFGISPREAMSLDPQQRLLLEVSWEALEHAGIAPDNLVGSQTGVFVGISTSDYSQMQLKSGNLKQIDAYIGTGGAFSVAAGRISYIMGLNGPALAVDTACSSSLVAIHLACQSLRGGQSKLALAGGVSLILTPEASIYMSKAKALAPDGRCKTFDKNADGYGRGEGCGVVVLKRLADALTDGDNILALIRGSAINHDGRSSGLTVPNGQAQQAVIRAALADAGDVNPHDVDYVEAHGTGTPLGDPIEVRALAAALGKGRPKDKKLGIGSVKTNIGHLEAASGIAGLIKLVLSLQHQEFPRHLHLQEPTPHIDWDSIPVEVVAQRIPWLNDDTPRLAGVSSFGFSGTNAHILLEEAPLREMTLSETKRPLHLLSLSAKNPAALSQLVAQLETHLASFPDTSSANLAHTLNVGRAHFAHRLAVVGQSSAEIKDKLAAVITGEQPIGVISQPTADSTPSKIAFLFTGQGSQYKDMGQQLYQTQPTFRAALDQCDELLRPYLEHPLLSVLYGEHQSLIDQTAYTQPALFALEYALAQLWRSWGIKPAMVMGHSVGEYVTACVAGVFSLEDGLKLIAERGRLMQALPQNGAMAAILTDKERVAKAIAPFAAEVSIAAVNGPTNIVISGRDTAINSIVNSLKADGIKARSLTVSHAFHSPLMEAMLDDFGAIAASVTYANPKIALISNVTGNQITGQEIGSAAYWRNHVRQAVQFEAAMQTLAKQGCNVFLEVGPDPVLLGMGKRCLPENSGLWASSLRKGQDNWQQMLNAVGQLYVAGVDIDWTGFDKDYVRQRIPLPTYPFQRQRYWITSSTVASPALMQTLVELPDPAEFKVNEWLYKVSWQVQERKSAPEQVKAGSWLILTDTGGVGDELARQLQARDQQCVLARSKENHAGNNSTDWLLDPANPAEFRTLLQDVTKTVQHPLRGVVYLWGLDMPQPAEVDIADLAQAQLSGLGSVLHLLQTMATDLKATDLPKLWLVTRSAQNTGPDSPVPINASQAMLWGFGKTIALEHGRIWGGLIDLDSTPSNAEAVDLMTEILQPGNEQQIAFRNQQRYVARLVSITLASLNLDSSVLKPDGAYLITGGLGGLGLEVARWLAQFGARRLILLGRTPLPPRSNWKTLSVEHPLFSKTEAIRQIERLGASVHTAAVDVADTRQLTDFIENYRQEDWPPIRGVIHAAGVIQDTSLLNMDTDAIQTVIRPKVDGAWLLHQLLQDAPLDFFVMFSSLASMGGSAGQGNYAAANAFLDALVSYRRSRGEPALSINWGPWAKVGMAADAKLEDQRARRGIASIEPTAGLTILGLLLRENGAQIGVMPATPAQMRQMYPADNPFLDMLTSPAQAGALPQVGPQEAVLAQILDAPADKRRTLIKNHLQYRIAKILLMEPDTLPTGHNFMELGMDSIMIMELIQNLDQDLQIPLQAREVFERPSVDELSGYLLTELERTHVAASAAKPVSVTLGAEALAQFTQRSHEALKKPAKQNPGIVFLLSSPRSGSTLLRVMLAGHKHLFCPPELHLLPFNNMAEHHAQLAQSYLNEGLQRAMMELMDIDAEQSKAILTDWSEQTLPVPQAYARLQELAHPRLLVDKSPSYAIDTGILDQAEALFADAKYIYLVRHPYAMIDSFVRRRLDKLFDMGEIDAMALAESVWSVTNQNIINFLSQIDPQRHHKVYYEELVANPRPVMEGLSVFLDISFDPTLLSPYQGQRMTDGVHEQSLSIGDPNFLKHTKIDPALGDTWKKISLPRPLAEPTQQIAAMLKYELPREIEATTPPTLPEAHFGAPSIQPIPRPQALPLSFSQQRLWFLNQLDPDSPGYNMPIGAFKLNGPLDVSVLEKSLNELFDRHEVLRTTFTMQNDQLVQLITAQENFTLPLINFEDEPEATRQTKAQQWAIEEVTRPFDLAQGPLFRPVLLRLSQEEHLLLLTMHHIISDGWSIGVMINEITTLYQAFLAEQPIPLPKPVLQYADYAVWQQQWLQGDVLDTQLAYWKEHLEGAPEGLALPTDYPRPEQHSFRGARQLITLPASLKQAINALSKQQSTTPFMVMLTALNITLSKWTHQQDMVLGTVIANRTRSETKNMLGCFMNFLPLRAKISPQETGLQLLEQIKSTFLQAYIYQDCPFEKLVDATRKSRNFNQNPLYNVAFLLQNLPKSSLFGNNISTKFVPFDIQSSLLDLRLVVQESPEGMFLWCEYNTDLFKPETIEYLLTAYQKTLEQLLESPQAPISQVEIPEALMTQAQEIQKRDQKQKLAISATFTAELVEKVLVFWAQRLDIERDIEFAPYNQVFQELLNPTSLLNTNRFGTNVILVRFEDWHRFQGINSSNRNDVTETHQKLNRNLLDLISALKSATKLTTVPFLICICPASPQTLSNPQLTALYQQMEEQLVQEIDAISNTYLITPAELFKTYPVESYYDPDGDELGHIPYTSPFFVALGTMITRKIHAITSPPHKVIVLDCDRTLWNGICGEDGALGVSVDEPYRVLQEFMIAQYEAGILLCLCSKNVEEDVWAVFDTNPNMVLKREHLTTWKINWQPKSANIKALAQELNLGLDSFIFVDDNPVECAEVQAGCPEVLTLQLPEEAAIIPKFLNNIWAFDHLKTTKEDKDRTAMYRQNIQREQFKQESLTFDNFLEGLNLEILISTMTPEQIARVSQLTQRTNQFNFTTIRRTESEIELMSQDDQIDCLVVEVNDRFGQYGLVGVMLAEINTDDKTLNVDSFILSCRVLGRGVEHRMLARLGQIAQAHGLDWVTVNYKPTPKNQPAFDFIESVGADFKQKISDEFTFKLPAIYASSLTFRE